MTFSINGGFYEEPFELTLSCDQHGKVIHYTTNGNTPTANDPIYQEPLLLDESLYSRSDIYTIHNCPDELWFQPESVKKCIVIRAAVFDEAGNRIGKVATNTYLIKSAVTHMVCPQFPFAPIPWICMIITEEYSFLVLHLTHQIPARQAIII